MQIFKYKYFLILRMTFALIRVIDQCMITRDKQGYRDDVLDEDTLEFTSQEGDSNLVYSGKCIVQPISSKDMNYDEGSLPVYRKVYNLLIPIDSNEVIISDTVTILSTQLDETLVGVEFRVQEVRYRSHGVYRYIRIEDVLQDYQATNPTV